MKKQDYILSGSMWKAVLIFFFPILLGTFFQQLYNTVDAAIVGRFAGKIALSSVGGSSAIIINLLVGFFTGLSAGCTVKISQFFGARDEEHLSTALHTSYAFGILGGIVMGLIGILLSPWVLSLMNTPAELMHDSILYLRFYFAGLVFVFLYNMGSAVLRALGNSLCPLIVLIICTIINIGLDFLFVIAFRWGVVGVAAATLISQAVSAVLVSLWLMLYAKEVKLFPRKIRINPSMLGGMLRIGLPSGIQSSTYSLSNIFIQTAINGFGVNTISGWTAEGKVDVIFWMINGSFGIAAATVVGQNYGARNIGRVRKGTRTVLLMDLVIATIISVGLYFFGKYPLYLFATEADVIHIGFHMMQVIVPAYPLFVFIEIFSSSLRAQGDNMVPTIINISCIVVFRVVWLSINAGKGILDLILYCYPISWALCAFFMTIYYLIRRNRKKETYHANVV